MYHKFNFRIVLFLFFVLLISIIFQGCDSSGKNPIEPEIHERGEIENVLSMGNMTANDIQQLLASIELEIPFTLSHSVEAISVTYYTINANGTEQIASGAILAPQGVTDLPLVSIQHGTETKRDLVASVSPVNSVEGIVGLIMASMGYMVLIPDYLGFGVSNVMHPYMHVESLVPSVIDFMRAGKIYCSENQIALDGRTFLTGYSEGGYVTLITQKVIEENYTSEFNLTAVAPSSGPYDLEGMMQTIFQSNSYGTPAYIAFILTAYNTVYNWNRLDDFFNVPYASMMPDLFDGSHTWGDIANTLPSSFSELVNSTFIEDVNNGNEQDFLNSVQDNTVLDWTPNTPIHFFHGESDEIVPIQNAYTAIENLSASDATNIILTVIPNGTHESSGQSAIFGTIEWFETF